LKESSSSSASSIILLDTSRKLKFKQTSNPSNQLLQSFNMQFSSIILSAIAVFGVSAAPAAWGSPGGGTSSGGSVSYSTSQFFIPSAYRFNLNTSLME